VVTVARRRSVENWSRARASVTMVDVLRHPIDR
jgi:hypothetical protein